MADFSPGLPKINGGTMKTYIKSQTILGPLNTYPISLPWEIVLGHKNRRIPTKTKIRTPTPSGLSSFFFKWVKRMLIWNNCHFRRLMYVAKRNDQNVCSPEPQVLFNNLTIYISIHNQLEQIFSTWLQKSFKKVIMTETV